MRRHTFPAAENAQVATDDSPSHINLKFKGLLTGRKTGLQMEN